jgi:hypothetical protein
MSTTPYALSPDAPRLPWRFRLRLALAAWLAPDLGGATAEEVRLQAEVAALVGGRGPDPWLAAQPRALAEAEVTIQDGQVKPRRYRRRVKAPAGPAA